MQYARACVHPPLKTIHNGVPCSLILYSINTYSLITLRCYLLYTVHTHTRTHTRTLTHTHTDTHGRAHTIHTIHLPDKLLHFSQLHLLHSHILNIGDGVAANTLRLSGDQDTRDTPPPPIRCRGVATPSVTSQT